MHAQHQTISSPAPHRGRVGLWLAPSLLAVVLAPAGAWAVPLQAGVTPVTAPDAALLNRVVTLLSTPQGRARAAAAGRLAGLTDARSVHVLAYVARHDRAPQVAMAAVKGLGALGKAGRAEVTGQLAALGRDAERQLVAEAAQEQLGALRTGAAFAALSSLAADEEVPQALRKRAVAVARRYFPKRSDELPRLAGRAGPAAIGGVAFGGYTLGMIGRFAASDSAEVVGWITGGVLGGAGGWLVGRELPVERQAYYASGLFWGAAVGSLLGQTISQAPARQEGEWQAYQDDLLSHDRFVAGLSVAGEVLAGLCAWAVADQLDMSAGDVIVTDLGGASAFLLTWGLLLQATPPEDSRPGAAIMAASTLAGLGLAVWVAPRLKFTQGDTLLTGLGAAEGAAYGLSISSLVLTKNSDRSGGKMGGATLMGTSLGLVAAGALSQVSDLSPGEVGQMMLLSQLGKALGAGSVLLSNPDDADPVLAGMLVGGTAGLLAAGTVARSLRYQGGAAPLVGISTGWGLWHGAAVGAWLERHGGFEGTRIGGLTLLSGGVFGLGAVAASQVWQFSAMEASMGSTGLAWGAWIAGWSGSLTDWKVEDVMFATAIGGDVGAALSAVLVSPLVGLDPLVIGGASLGGIGLAGVGTMAAMMVTENRDRWVQANIAGSVLGLALGGAVTAQLLAGRAQRRKKAGLGAQRPDLTPSWLRGVAATPLMDRDGRMQGMTLGVQGVL